MPMPDDGALIDNTALMWGKWGKQWAMDVIKWDEHVSRANVPTRWGLHLRQWHDSRWLLEQRLAQNQGNSVARTGTRASAGRPATRWQEGVAAAKAECRNR